MPKIAGEDAFSKTAQSSSGRKAFCRFSAAKSSAVVQHGCSLKKSVFLFNKNTEQSSPRNLHKNSLKMLVLEEALAIRESSSSADETCTEPRLF